MPVNNKKWARKLSAECEGRGLAIAPTYIADLHKEVAEPLESKYGKHSRFCLETQKITMYGGEKEE